MTLVRANSILSLLLMSLCMPGMANDDPRAREIVQRMDELYRADSSETLMQMMITTPTGNAR
ncbi:MAG TPA: hypothetical protein ENN40_07745 [Candidatus Aminicenantes bacterium]|nr:hypothetical protein [Candidatus Aminicenantes bacterium]